MKTILVPTDFSDSANNACNYAIELARKTKAKLILFHVFQIPVPVNEVPVVVVSVDDLRKESLGRLKHYAKEIKRNNAKDVEVESIVSAGFAIDEIIEITKEKNIDLIVMGIVGGSRLNEILGSTTTGVVRKTTVPVLIVPDNARFKQIDKIAFACDYSQISNRTVLAMLFEFVKLFTSRILVVNVIAKEEITTTEKAVSGMQLENYLKDVDHTIHFPVHSDVIEGINEFVKDTDSAMIAMIPHKHNIFQRIFSTSNTKKMAFHTHIPLLMLPQNN